MFFPLFFLPSSWKCFIYVGGVGGHLNHLTAENYTCNLSQRSSTEKQKNSSRSAEKIVVNHPQPLHLGRFTMCTRPFYNSSKHEGWKGQMMEKHRLVLYFSSTEWKVRWIISFVFFFFILQSAGGVRRSLTRGLRGVFHFAFSFRKGWQLNKYMRFLSNFLNICFATFLRQNLYNTKFTAAPCHCIKYRLHLFSMYFFYYYLMIIIQYFSENFSTNY